MSVKEVLGGQGTWTLALDERLPEEIRAKLDFFGHVVILRGEVDISQYDNTSLLTAARYVGVTREIDLDDRHEIGGGGMVLWLGDEDEKGAVIENKITLTSRTLAQAVATIVPLSGLLVGTVFAQPDPAQRITTTFQYVSPRSALQTVCDTFGVEFRVNGNGTVDVGAQSSLYTSTPDSIVVREGAGVDMDIVALGAKFQTQRSAVDYSSRILLVGKTNEDATFTIGTADAPAVPYRDLFGNPVKRTRMISESGTTTGSVAQRTQLQLNRYNRTTAALKITADDYEIEGNFVVGDMTYVYDPDSGIVNPAIERYFRGEVLHPDLIRVSELTWSITDDHTVAFRTDSGEWIDLTRWVVFETGTNEIVVGDLPKSLTSPTGNPVLDRADSLPDASIPSPPTGLALATTSALDSIGRPLAQVLASWTAPGSNIDGTPLVDLSHYIIRYRPAFRAPQWTVSYVDTTAFDFPATVGLVYDAEVAAVDKAGNVSAYTPIVSITAAVDTTAPPAPSDPSVTAYLGQLRIEWDGLTNLGGAMPPDFNRVDVHVGTTTGFAPSASTLIASLSTKGVAYATAPYGLTRYVRLIAYDRAQNASSASNTVSGATARVADGDIASMSVGKLTAGIMSADVTISGRFATALTGARTELNALGLQKWDSANNLLVSITGTEALLTGRYKSALSGRRIEMGSAGSVGEIQFIAPDGKTLTVRGRTESSGVEAIQIGMLLAGKSDLWNVLNINSQEWSNLRSWRFESIFQTTSSQGLGSGFWRVFQGKGAVDTGGGSTVERLYFDSSWTRLSVDNNGTFRVQENNTGNVMEPRFTILTTQTWFEWPETNSRIVFISPGARNDLSGILQLANGFNYVCQLRYLSTSTGASSRLEIRDAGSGYVGVNGGTYTDLSRRDSKTEIVNFDGDATAMLLSVPVRKFRRKGPTGRREKFTEGPKVKDRDGREQPGRLSLDEVETFPGEEGPVQIGVVVEESPAEWVTTTEEGAVGVQYAAQIATLIKFAQETAARLDAIERKGKP